METSRHLIDPELLVGLERLPSFVLSDAALAEMRAAPALDPPDMPALPLPCPVEREILTVSGPPSAPDLELFVYRPAERACPSGAYLHIHGGGYVLGTPEMCDPGNRQIAAELGCLVVSVNYRLAPDTPHPGPLEDCYAALAWLYRNAPSLGVDAGRIAVGGESAGGGLAAALAILARDRGEYPIAHQHLIYPMIDDRTGSSRAPTRHTGEFIWNAESNRFGWRALLGMEPGSADAPAVAVPARCEALAGLPSTFIGTAALDLFLAENLDYARRLIDCGVPTELVVAPGAYHGFEQIVPEAAVSRRFIAAGRAALSRGLGRTGQQ